MQGGAVGHLQSKAIVAEQVLRRLTVDVVHLGEGRDRPVQHRVAVGLDVLDGVAVLPARVLAEEAVQRVLHRVSRRVPGDVLPQRVAAHQHHRLVGAVVAHKLGAQGAHHGGLLLGTLVIDSQQMVQVHGLVQTEQHSQQLHAAQQHSPPGRGAAQQLIHSQHRQCHKQRKRLTGAVGRALPLHKRQQHQ